MNPVCMRVRARDMGKVKLTVMKAPRIKATMYDHHGSVVCPLNTTIKPRANFISQVSDYTLRIAIWGIN